jgi:hypothetical protein
VVAIGYKAGNVNATNQNVFIGWEAGLLNTTGNFNTFIGNNAGPANTTGISNTFVGRFAGVGNTTGAQNSFYGTNAGQTITTGQNNTMLGYQTGNSNTTGSNHVILGANANCSSGATSCIVIGSGVNGVTSSSVTFQALRSTSGGAQMLQIGTGEIITMSSSKKFKENIQPIEIDTSGIYQLEPISYDMKNEYSNECLKEKAKVLEAEGRANRSREIGLLAEDVYKLFPELVPLDNDNLPFSVDYSRLSVLLLNEMQVLNKRVQQLEEDNKKIKELLTDL